jgi:exosortase
MKPAGAAAAAWVGAGLLVLLAAIPLAAAWRLAPDLGHGWAAPLLIAYLWWERWNERPAIVPGRVSPGAWIAAALVAALALPLRLFLTPFPLWPTLVWSYLALLAAVALGGAGLLAGRPGVRWVAGPLIILAAALPWGTQLEQHLIYPLREGMASITAEVSNLLGRPAIATGTSVRLGSGWVGVDEACGGIRSLEASIMLALFFGEWLRLSWPRRSALVGAGIFAALLGNFLRILFLALRSRAGPAAFLAVHDAAGWLALAFTLALTGLLAFRWTRSTPRPTTRRRAGPRAMPAGAGPAAGWLLAVTLLLLADEGAVRAWYARGTQVHPLGPAWTVQLPESAPDFRLVPLSEEAREMLVPDHYIGAYWQLDIDSTASAYYVAWDKGQAARSVPFAHNPTICLPLAGCELEKSLGEIRVPWSGGEIPFHAYVFRRAGEDLVVAFAMWDTARGRELERPAEDGSSKRAWLLSRWRDVREARRDQPAQLFSLAVTGPGAEARLHPLLSRLVIAP